MKIRNSVLSRSNRAHRTLRSLAVLAAPLLLAPIATSQMDVFSTNRTLVQVITTGTTTMVAGKSTMVRVSLDATGTVPAGTFVDGLLRVIVGGVEAPWSPVYSQNGPLDVSIPPNFSAIGGSLNFIFLPPLSDDVVLVVELNPPGPTHVPETDTTNNTITFGTRRFGCRRIAELVYVPIDYRPTGGPVPNLPEFGMIKPSVGDNFIQGIFPAPDWEYHQSEAPSKLWTSSLAGSGSALNSSLLSDLQMMNPKPDFIFGWVPGSLPYNGQASGVPGQAAIGNTQAIRHQRTFAHELGHLFGLQHNSTKLNTLAVDVEHHLNEPLALSQVKAGSLNDVMSAGLLTNQAWVATGNYQFFLNHNLYDCQQPLTFQPEGDSLLVAGVWNHKTASLELTNTVAFGGARPTSNPPLDQAELVLRAYAGGQLVAEVGVAANSATDGCPVCSSSSDSEWQPVPDAGFATVLPATIDPARIERLVLVDPRTGSEVSVMEQSQSAPVVEFVSPAPGELLGEMLLVEWDAVDADGDELSYYLRYSPDGVRLVPLATGTTVTSLEVDLAALPAYQPGVGYFEVIATDGLRSTSVKTIGPRGGQLYAGVGGNDPTTQILTPDNNKSYAFGATVVLHSSGWDIEDRALTGTSIVWTSDLDGLLATGRVTSTTALTVGTHALTVTATDSSGATATDTNTVVITARSLPGGVTCQTDLGFGGPGTSVLSLCGGDLSTGTTADILLAGGEPNAVALLAVGNTFAPTALLGGMIVPVPSTVVVVGATDGSGEWLIPAIPGGGGPFTLYMQAVYLDVAQVADFGISNALQVDFLP